MGTTEATVWVRPESGDILIPEIESGSEDNVDNYNDISNNEDILYNDFSDDTTVPSSFPDDDTTLTDLSGCNISNIDRSESANEEIEQLDTNDDISQNNTRPQSVIITQAMVAPLPPPILNINENEVSYPAIVLPGNLNIQPPPLDKFPLLPE